MENFTHIRNGSKRARKTQVHTKREREREGERESRHHSKRDMKVRNVTK